MGAIYNHAKDELNRLSQEPDVDFGDPKFYRMILHLVSAFSKYGHSGGSTEVTVDIFSRLVRMQNLTPLTDDPDEWWYHAPNIAPPNGLYQNKRNTSAFSQDGGATYYLLEETDNGRNVTEDKKHASDISGKRPAEEVIHLVEQATGEKEYATIKDGRLVSVSLDAEVGPGGGHIVSVGEAEDVGNAAG